MITDSKPSSFRDRTTYGTFIQIGHPAIAEILANAGFEWIAVDMEHSDIDNRQFADLCRGMHGRGAVPMARVKSNDTLAIRQVLDQGAGGVIVPMVESAEEARRTVEAAKYPPEGRRGISFHRANDYGIRFSEDVAAANDEILVLVMIETRSGAENIESILEVPGVDGIFMGPYDLSGSYGVVGQLDHPDVTAAMDRCVKACKKTGKLAGTHVAHPNKATMDRLKNSGYRFFGLGFDSLFLDSSARSTLISSINGKND